MAELRFKAFLSCSFAAEDASVTEFFRRLLASFDIDVDVYDYQEVGRVPDKVKERIVLSDCLVAIATRRKKIEGSDQWTLPDWIRDEISFASACKKPIAIFAEENVRIEGLIATEERREKFARENLLANIDKLVRFLFNLRAHLETLYRFDRLNIPALIRHYVHVKEEIRSKDLLVRRCEVLMECIADELEATYHFTELEDRTPGLTIRPKHFDFVCKEMPAGMKVKPERVQETDSKFMWKLNFVPSLKKGERVKYAFKATHSNTRPFTYEELTERIARGTYNHKEPICEACQWMITFPTADFRFDVEFPENYELSDYRADVKMGVADLRADAEVQRIKSGNMFSAEKIIDKWSMGLQVIKPLQDHTYYIYYVPPPQNSLVANG